MLRERRPKLLTRAGLLLACLLVVLGGPLAASGTTAIGPLDQPATDASGTPAMPSETAGLPSPAVAEPVLAPAESEPADTPARRLPARHGHAVHPRACAARAMLARRHPHRGRGPPAA